MQPLHVPAGATIFSIGEPSRGVYVIEDGEVSITAANATEVACLHPGDLFGESGVLEARPRSATATAITSTTLLVTPADTFLHAFGMDNDRALSLVKLLCRRLRDTTRRASQQRQAEVTTAAIRLFPDSEELETKYRLSPVDVLHLPFQVGNRFGGETLPIGSNHTCCIAARGDPTLCAPHFEILRRDGRIGVRDLGTASGTIVNGTVTTRASLNGFIPLQTGNNILIAGPNDLPFRFRLVVTQ